MKTIPTDVLLSWPIPNYKNPHTQGQSLVVTNIVFMSLTTLVVSLRYYSRLRNHKWLGLDDIFIGIALVFSLLLGAVVILANVRYGWNRHIWDVEPTQYEAADLVAFVAKIIFSLASTFTRISLICFYFRLIRDSGHSKFRWVLWFNIGWQVAVCVTFIFETVFLCNPVYAYWDIYRRSTAKCLNEGTVTVIAGIINCVSDFMITILPIPIIMRLNMPLKQRIGVCVLLSLGIIVTVAGILRTYFIWKALISTYDETWYSYRLWICATVEIDLAVLCACVPALKPLVSPSIKALRSLTRSLRNTAHHGTRQSTNTTTNTLNDRNTSIGSSTLRNKDGSVETEMRRTGSNTTGCSQAAILHEKQDREYAHGSWATGKGLGWFSWEDDDHNDASHLERGDRLAYGQAVRMSTSEYHIAGGNLGLLRDEDDVLRPIGNAYAAEDRYTGQGIRKEESFAVSVRPR